MSRSATLVAPLRPLARPVHDRRGERALRPGRRAGAAGARARGEARPRRAPAGRHRARMVRPGRSPPPTPCVARRAPQGGRARRAGDPRPLPAELARDRPARDAPRGARTAPGTALPVTLGRATCCLDASPLPARAARPALCDRRGRLGRRRSRPGCALLPGGRRCARPPGRGARARGRGARPDPGALGTSAEFWFDLLAETGLEAEAALPALWDLVWAGEATNDAWQPLRAVRRYGIPKPERRPRRSPVRVRPSRPRRRAAGRSPKGCLPASRTAVRSRSSCSSGKGSSPATASAARGSPEGTAPCTAS